MSNSENKRRPWWRRGVIVVALVALAAFGYVSARLAQQQFPAATASGLPDLLSAPPRPLPAGALHVQDLAADLHGFQGEIAVRGVVARYAPNDPTLFALVDTREARLCKSTGCAKFYLPVKWTGSGARPKEWDELNLRGQLVHGLQYTYLRVSNLENLGPMK